EDSKGNHYISVRGKAAPEGALAEVAERVSGNAKLFEGHVDVFGTDDFPSIIDAVRQVELDFGGYGFMPTAATYHRFMSGLQGGKMSSSVPESLIALTDDPKEASKKVKRAKTGGCVTLDEQKKHGGEPENCSVYELLLFHLIDDDKELMELHSECVGGKRMCGSCKSLAAELMSDFLIEHQELRELARDRLDEYGL
ncbi:MAG: tryptophan--tRNA ligase, partial [Methanosarcinaceae archaeon]|nr:tryptophan--tRNA ligase [Methanosarcinaceae archaeon]